MQRRSDMGVSSGSPLSDLPTPPSHPPQHFGKGAVFLQLSLALRCKPRCKACLDGAERIGRGRRQYSMGICMCVCVCI